MAEPTSYRINLIDGTHLDATTLTLAAGPPEVTAGIIHAGSAHGTWYRVTWAGREVAWVPAAAILYVEPA